MPTYQSNSPASALGADGDGCPCVPFMVHSEARVLDHPWRDLVPVLALDAPAPADALARLPTGGAPRLARARRRSSLGALERWDLFGALARVAECDDSTTGDSETECRR